MADKQQLLVPLEKYLQAGIHIGSKFKTGFMSKYIYKVRPDGLNILNLSKIDEKLDAAADFLAKYDPSDILVVCRRENGRKAVKKFGELTGIKVVAGRYFPGTMTNPSYEGYMDPKLLFVCDPWLDRQAVLDAVKSGIPVVALCDTNNVTSNVDLVVPCNNKGAKSLKLIFYILAREYLRRRGVIEKTADIEWF
jgi:small subunit ribosomal protein S2